MDEALDWKQVGVVGVLMLLVLQQVLTFVRWTMLQWQQRRNNNSKRGGPVKAEFGCAQDVAAKHSKMLARHDEAITGLRRDLERIEKTLRDFILKQR